MVVVNLYAFEKTAAKPGVHFEELIENIDIGGPSMIRSAAKNFSDVAVVTSPADYGAIAEEMARSATVFPGKRSGGWRRRRLPRLRLTIRPSLRRWSGWAETSRCTQRRAFRKFCGCRFRKRWTCATEKIRIRRRPCTPTFGRGRGERASGAGQRASYNNIVDCKRRGIWRAS